MENQSLIEENEQLKKAIAVLLNKKLMSEINEALSRIENGEFVSEDDFFKNSPVEEFR